MGRDQNDNAARVAARGAGLRLDPGAAPDAIAEALRILLADPTYRAAAGRLGRAIAAETDPEAAADALETVASRHAALRPLPLAASGQVLLA
jgi:UDP:flavonoid glycosyltransferase YjiC (YdhE family)